MPIAIIGMGCRFPDADGLEAYASLLLEGRCAIRSLPPERFHPRYFDDDPSAYAKSVSRIGAWIEDQPFDPRGLRLSKTEIDAADTVHLWALDVARSTIEHAGFELDALRGRDVAVMLGHSRGSMKHSDLAFATSIDAMLRHAEESERWNALDPSLRERIREATITAARTAYPPLPRNGIPAYRASGTASLIASAFDFRGRHFVVDAACASSLAALDMAVRSLRQGSAEYALTGGAAFTSPHSMVLFSNSMALSPDGSFPFDARANGFVASDGVGMILLARLDDAIARGHRIHGIIHAVGASCDGRGKGLWAPNRAGQVIALRNAYQDGAVRPSDISYIEAHGTSTALGDATEIESLTEFFGPHFEPGRKLPIGSVKSNIGHSREAAGIAGILKVLLAFDRGVIPPSIGCRTPNPGIDWTATPVTVARDSMPWKTNGRPRVAAVDSFGIGGLNYHVVLEEPPSTERIAELLQHAGSRPADDGIAIVGIGCITPAARGPERLWKHLSEGRSAAATVPADRWPVDIFHVPGEVQPYRTNTATGAFVTDFEPDWKRYRMPPALVKTTDPLQLMLLEAALDALSDAGIDPAKADRERIGVSFGTLFGSDYALEISMAIRAPEVAELLEEAAVSAGLPAADAHAVATDVLARIHSRLPVVNGDASGSSSSSPHASRIASTLDLHGPVSAVDASYSSALVALESACDSLRTRASDTMLWAGGDRGTS